MIKRLEIPIQPLTYGWGEGLDIKFNHYDPCLLSHLTLCNPMDKLKQSEPFLLECTFWSSHCSIFFFVFLLRPDHEISLFGYLNLLYKAICKIWEVYNFLYIHSLKIKVKNT